ncbi:MAG: SDR family oxidoreductase [Candidatus Brocadiales bacterium]
MMKTIFITGGTGFLGSSLVRRLAREDNRLILLVRNKALLKRGGLEGLLSEEDGSMPVHSDKIELVEGDITRTHLGLNAKEYSTLADEADTVFHCATLTGFNDREALLRTNFEGTRHVLDFATALRLKRYHHISSAYVTKKKGSPYCIDAGNVTGLNNAYEETKLVGEVLVRKYVSSFQLPATVYRPSIIVGNSETGYTKCYKGMYSFAKALYLVSRTSKYARNEPFRIFGDGEATVDLVPVDYVADGIIAVCNDKGSVNKTFNITNPCPPTLHQLKEMMTCTLGMKNPAIVPLTDHVQPGNSLEKFYLSYTRPYLPYVHNRYIFDSSSTHKLLTGTGITCPVISQELTSLLIHFARRNNWGDKVEKKRAGKAFAIE